MAPFARASALQAALAAAALLLAFPPGVAAEAQKERRKACTNVLPGLVTLNAGVDAVHFDAGWSGTSTPLQPIFRFTCEEGRKWNSPYSDETYDVPDQMASMPLSTMVIRDSGSTEIIKKKEESSKTFSLGGGFDFGGIPVSIIDSLEAQTDFSSETSKALESQKYVAQKSKNLMFYNLNLAPPDSLLLTEDFHHYLEKLPEDLTEEGAIDKYVEFVKYFGTHYVASGNLGGMFLYTVEIEKEWADSQSDDNIDANVGLGFAELFGVNTNSGGDSASSSSEFKKNSRTKTQFIGGSGLSSDVEDWQKTIPDNPVMLHAKLEPLSELIKVASGISKERALKIAGNMERGVSHRVKAAVWNDQVATLKVAMERLDDYMHTTSTKFPYTLKGSECDCRFCHEQSEDAAAFSLSQGCDSGVKNIDEWVEKHCGGWGIEGRCTGLIQQEVRRVQPPFENVNISVLNSNITKQIKQMAADYYQEYKETHARLSRAVEFLAGGSFSGDVSESEMRDTVLRAGKIAKSPDKSMTFSVGVPVEGSNDLKLKEDQSCTCFKITQARYLWDGAEDAKENPTKDGKMTLDWGKVKFGIPNVNINLDVGAELAEKATAARNVFQAGDEAAVEYAKRWPKWTSAYLVCFPYCLYSEWLCDSGPLLPPYTLDCGVSYMAPSSNVYNQGFSFPWGALGLCYLKSLPLGCCTPCPGVAQFLGWELYGRPLPERPLCGSHPSALCCQLDHGDNNRGLLSVGDAMAQLEKEAEEGEGETGRRLRASRPAGWETNLEVYGTTGGETDMAAAGGGRAFFAPRGHVYDARLVEALHRFADEGARVRALTLFSTTLTHFKFVGLHPEDPRKMHMGVTLEFSQPVALELGGAASSAETWRFLTLEMMANGMMWTLTEASEPTRDYDYQQKIRTGFDDLSPRVVARYLSAQRGRRYRVGVTDCQTVAVELERRCLLHGAPSGQVFEDLHTGRFSGRFLVVLSAVLLATSGLAAVAAHLWRKWRRAATSARAPLRITAAGVFMTFLASSFLATGNLMAIPAVAATYYHHRRKGQKAEGLYLHPAGEE